MSTSKGRRKNPETKILNSISEYLRLHGFFVYRNQQSLGSHKGIADLTALKRGLPAIYVEVKSEKGTLSDYQKNFRDEVIKHGHIYIVAISVEGLIESLRNY